MIGVTGANGLLGSFIVRKLIDEGREFVAFKREASDTTLLSDVTHPVTWRHLDVLDPVSIEEALDGVSSVIHAAGMVSFSPRHTSLVRRTNTEGTRNMVNASLSRGVKRFIHVSSVAALGRTKGQSNVDESNKWSDHVQHSFYASSKYYAELEVFRGQEEGLSTAIINPSVILAPGDWEKSSAQLFKFVWDEHFFYMDGSLNYVDVRDVAAATLSLLDSGMENERLIANAGVVTFKEFFDAVAARFGKKPPRIKLNGNFLKIVAGIETISAGIRRSDPKITPETARLAGRYFCYENKKIENLLRFEFRPLEDTLNWCCQYYRQKFKKG